MGSNGIDALRGRDSWVSCLRLLWQDLLREEILAKASMLPWQVGEALQ